MPKNYRGTKSTNRHIRHLLPSVLSSLSKTYERRGDLILVSWPDIIGEKFASFTKAISFIDGALRVRVSNSTLLSLLMEHEKTRLIKELKAKFPASGIKTIHFFIG